MSNIFERTELLVGSEGIEKLNKAKVIVFGIGGVGGHAVEALPRSGVGNLTLVDNDVVSVSNINRQIIALHSTVGRYKTEVMKERILDVNPECNVETINLFYDLDTAKDFDLSKYDYVIDAIDSVKSKIELIVRAKNAGTPVISAMGAGNKLHPELFEIADISKTSVCPLARIVRKELKVRGINHLKVVYSKEQPVVPLLPKEEKGYKLVPGSTAFSPSVMGLIIASEIVKDIIQK